VKMDAKILILDDSLSAVDNRTEASILAALEELRRKNQTTTIIISHKLSSLRDVDHILVLEDGMMAEYGTPKDLLSRQGSIYSHLYRIQTQGGAHLG
jgi:ABC-type multidrug transport system fused ATPase/permease subunit